MNLLSTLSLEAYLNRDFKARRPQGWFLKGDDVLKDIDWCLLRNLKNSSPDASVYGETSKDI